MEISFRIIPVIDIQKGIAVGSRMGPNHEYLPLKTQLLSPPDPVALARLYRSEFGLKDIYVADLDSIMEINSDNSEIIQEIGTGLGAGLIVDTGLRSRRQFEKINKLNSKSIVISTECMKNWDLLYKALEYFGSERIIVSLDTHNGQIMSSCPEIASSTLLSFCQKLHDMGVTSCIFLELSLVGKSSGVIPEAFLEIRSRFPFQILLAGGFATEAQILNAKNAGFNGVMVSTGLHLRSLSPDKIRVLVTASQN